jgi:hypothetical protein
VPPCLVALTSARLTTSVFLATRLRRQLGDRLEQRIASQNKKVGRPQCKSDAWNAATAERNAALLVASDQAAWRKKTGRERVPIRMLSFLIDAAGTPNAFAASAMARLIMPSVSAGALKAGRI